MELRKLVVNMALHLKSYSTEKTNIILHSVFKVAF